MREERGKEYCKLLLPLVSCLERWVVCLLPRRTRYCATYLRTHPRQKSSSTSSLSSPSYSSSFVYLFVAASSLPLATGNRRSSSLCNRVPVRRKKYARGKSEPLGRPLRRATLANPSPFYSTSQFAFFFFAIRLRLLIV